MHAVAGALPRRLQPPCAAPPEPHARCVGRRAPQLGRLWGGQSDVPVADAKPEDIQDLLGGALFKALYKWMLETGPVYLLPTGPISSFLVISDPEAAKHVLRSSDNPSRAIYNKGLVAEVSQFLFGKGFAVAGGDEWRVRRRAVTPSLHKAYLEEMLDRVFGECALAAAAALEGPAAAGRPVNMEAIFNQMTLDVIGKAVFNYDFKALTTDSPIIQAGAGGRVHEPQGDGAARDRPAALLEVVPRQRKAAAAVELIRRTTEELIRQCKDMVDAEEQAAFQGQEDYMNKADPSILRFLIASREEVSALQARRRRTAAGAARGPRTCQRAASPRPAPSLSRAARASPAPQLRDDLLSMLVAGHETTGSVLTWTLQLLSTHPEQMAKARAPRRAAGTQRSRAAGSARRARALPALPVCAQAEVDEVLAGSAKPDLEQLQRLRYLMRCVNESMRLYPHPPVLLRRALVDDELPGGYSVPRGQDVMISVYNVHRSPAVWDRPDDFLPERFDLEGPIPNEQNTDYRRAGRGLGATIHTKNGLLLNSSRRIAGLFRHLIEGLETRGGASAASVLQGARAMGTLEANGDAGLQDGQTAAEQADQGTRRRVRRRMDEAVGGPVYVVGCARTPMGAFQGSLAPLAAPELGAIAIRAAVERAGVPPEAVEEVLMGNVCSANLGQAPARQAALRAGLPVGTDCTAVNKVCASGLKAVALGAQTIMAGTHSVVVAGGMESMSNIPYYAPAVRGGARLGNSVLVDGMLQARDGLLDAVHGIHMGECAELCARKYGFTREQQDAHAVESVERARRATEAGLVDWEVVPVEVPAGRGSTRLFTQARRDEPIQKADAEKLRRLRPFFQPEGGTVTAGNASPITDGSAAVVLASAEAEPREFTTAPALAIPRALEHAGLDKGEVDYWEVNEAFSVVDLVNQKLLGLKPERRAAGACGRRRRAGVDAGEPRWPAAAGDRARRVPPRPPSRPLSPTRPRPPAPPPVRSVNVFGGAVAIGHPIGASGTRLLVTLLNVLRCKRCRIGVAAICNGGGGASAMVLERMDGLD
eukprot:scaffold7.g3484.t1